MLFVFVGYHYLVVSVVIKTLVVTLLDLFVYSYLLEMVGGRVFLSKTLKDSTAMLGGT